jgi:hypothetical protein
VVTLHPTGALEVAATAQVPYRAWGRGGEFKPVDGQLLYSVPGAGFGNISADLSGLVPDATVILWTRANF